MYIVDSSNAAAAGIEMRRPRSRALMGRIARAFCRNYVDRWGMGGGLGFRTNATAAAHDLYLGTVRVSTSRHSYYVEAHRPRENVWGRRGGFSVEVAPRATY